MLDLSDTDIWRTIPKWSQKLTHEDLDLSNNQIHGPLLENIFYMIPQLYHWNNEDVKQFIKGIERDYAKNLKFLINMDLSNNSLSGTIPKCFLISGHWPCHILFCVERSQAR